MAEEPTLADMKRIVQQLEVEAKIERIPVSRAAQSIVQFCEQNGNDDPLQIRLNSFIFLNLTNLNHDYLLSNLFTDRNSSKYEPFQRKEIVFDYLKQKLKLSSESKLVFNDHHG